MYNIIYVYIYYYIKNTKHIIAIKLGVSINRD